MDDFRNHLYWLSYGLGLVTGLAIAVLIMVILGD